jgi:Mg2+-importing ATPase
MKLAEIKKNNNHMSVRSVSPVMEKLLAASRTEKDILLKEFNTSLKGYNEAAAEELRGKYGRNAISHDKPKPLYKRLVEAFINPFTIVLFILAAVSLVTDIILASPGEKKLVKVIII